MYLGAGISDDCKATSGRLFDSVNGWELSVPADERAAVTLSLSDDDFAKLVSGKTQAQRLFMSGKLKIKGDVMKVGQGIIPVLKNPLADLCLVGYKNGARAEEGANEGEAVKVATF